MRKAAEVYRLYFELGLGARTIARSLEVSHSTVLEYLSLLSRSGKTWPLAGPSELREILAQRQQLRKQARQSRVEPDYQKIFEELKRKGVTLQLLWQEYRESHGDCTYAYSRFCDLYRSWSKTMSPSFRQQYKGGEKMFVDYAGPTMSYFDPASGVEKKAVLFVAVLGASNFTYAEAQTGQDASNWLMGHVRSFEYFGGVPRMVVPDNLKAGVTSPCRYEPVINPSYHELSVHYGTAVVPARVRRPKDKAKAETGVLIVERWIMAALRNRRFLSLEEMNKAIRELLDRLNDKVMRRYGKSRRNLWEKVEKEQLFALPENRYEYRTCKKAQVSIDYHVAFDKNNYSVPYTLVGKSVDISASARMVDILYQGEVIASHPRQSGQGQYMTKTGHMPSNHQHVRTTWDSERFLRWAEGIGPRTRQVIATALESKDHPEQAFRRCLGILNLGKKYGEHRLEAACLRASTLKYKSYRDIRDILASGYDKVPPKQKVREAEQTVPQHPNLRGADYYTQNGGLHDN